ncbi:Uncharacterized protein DBV15_09793 [Temnothorax longispinosus]|uniref:Uncharacterized protein n=1 Tax=Temnothorax longispinosus TaxID=300112 RepID=A0A4S2JW84_9HYME|nr:Uncharacterized protein DBV15_09793 [Temnothorax longispinosus]
MSSNMDGVPIEVSDKAHIPRPCDKFNKSSQENVVGVWQILVTERGNGTYRVSAQHSSLRAFPPARQIAGRKGSGANSDAHTHIYKHTPRNQARGDQVRSKRKKDHGVAL